MSWPVAPAAYRIVCVLATAAIALGPVVTPKTVAVSNPVRVSAGLVAAPLSLWIRLITPLRRVVRVVADLITSWIVGEERGRENILQLDEFRTLLDNGAIGSVVVTDTRIEGKFRSPRDGKTSFVTNRVEPGFAELLDAAGIDYSGAPETNWLNSLLSWVLPTLFFLGIWLLLFRRIAEKQGMGGLMNIGQSKAKVYVEKETGITFDDVAGVDQAKMELQEVVAFLRDQEKYERVGAHVPKGILLVGPPGTGKTLLARAIAGEAGVVFFSISGSEFVEMFVGVGAARVRDLFDQARRAAPCIIFIDELDALGRARSAMGGLGGGHDEKEQTLSVARRTRRI